MVFFNASGALEQITQELYTVSASDWNFEHRGLTLASSYFLLLPLLFFSRRFSFLCSLSAAARFRRFLSLRHIWADYSWTPTTTWTMARRVDARRS